MLTRLVILVLSVILLGMQTDIYQTYSTAYFRIKYVKSISTNDVVKIGEMLEARYAEYKKKLHTTLNHKVNVYVLNSVSRFRTESRSKVFGDGAFRDGKIYLLSPALIGKDIPLEPIISRVVSRAILDEIKLCPPWLSECYSLYAGEDLARYGQPARIKISSFGDLSEEFSTAQRTKDINEVYAKLAVTADFFISRYGEKKFEGLFNEFNFNPSVEEVFEAYFGEKISTIEKAWVQALRSPSKE